MLANAASLFAFAEFSCLNPILLMLFDERILYGKQLSHGSTKFKIQIGVYHTFLEKLALG